MKPILSAAIMLCTATNFVVADDTYTLRYKFGEEQVLRSKVVHLVTVETKIKGTSQTAQSRSISIKNWKVEEVDQEGNATFVHQVENIDMWQKVTDRPELAFNSETDDIPPAIYANAAKAVGIPLSRITVDPQGKVLKREHLGGTQTSESRILAILPVHEIKVGASWFNNEEINVRSGSGQIKRVKVRQVSRLDGVAGGIATITTQSQVLTPIDDPSIKVELIQKLTRGQVKFDIEQGMIVDQQLDLNETVIGFQGEASVMNYVGRMTEKALPQEVRTASLPKNEPTPAKRPEPTPAKRLKPTPAEKPESSSDD